MKQKCEREIKVCVNRKCEDAYRARRNKCEKRMRGNAACGPNKPHPPLPTHANTNLQLLVYEFK